MTRLHAPPLPLVWGSARPPRASFLVWGGGRGEGEQLLDVIRGFQQQPTQLMAQSMCTEPDVALLVHGEKTGPLGVLATRG